MLFLYDENTVSASTVDNFQKVVDKLAQGIACKMVHTIIAGNVAATTFLVIGDTHKYRVDIDAGTVNRIDTCQYKNDVLIKRGVDTTFIAKVLEESYGVSED